LSEAAQTMCGGAKSPVRATPHDAGVRRRVLFVVEGFTDIRFVSGLSEICDLTMLVPARQYRAGGLHDRVTDLGLDLRLIEVAGGRPAFQLRSLRWLLRNARSFDLILAQEVLRGALNANLAGALRGVPVVTYMGIAPLEYFRCRYERGSIGRIKSLIGESAIRILMSINGRLATRCLAMGPYLQSVAQRHCPRSAIGLYYGVDTERFRPADRAEQRELRSRLDLPRDRFVILFSSRISHEKDPETVIRAVAEARARGLDAVLVNLGGGWREFLDLARKLGVPKPDDWLIGRPAVHPMTAVFEYFRAVDAVAMASLAEGAAYSTLEALACGTPLVATAVGGMGVQLNGLARLVPRRDTLAMADELLWIAANRDQARDQALHGREYVVREWARGKAFADLRQTFDEVAKR
jgi:glycosyltransferase involved in cell wall biosynthesis